MTWHYGRTLGSTSYKCTLGESIDLTHGSREEAAEFVASSFTRITIRQLTPDARAELCDQEMLRKLVRQARAAAAHALSARAENPGLPPVASQPCPSGRLPSQHLAAQPCLRATADVACS